MKVLFIGNSHTYYNDMPQIFADMCKERGKDVEVAIFIYENEDGSYKVSTRANGNVDLAVLAQHFHGGGHVKAAGFTMYGKPEEFLSEILAQIEKQL